MSFEAYEHGISRRPGRGIDPISIYRRTLGRRLAPTVAQGFHLGEVALTQMPHLLVTIAPPSCVRSIGCFRDAALRMELGAVPGFRAEQGAGDAEACRLPRPDRLGAVGNGAIQLDGLRPEAYALSLQLFADATLYL